MKIKAIFYCLIVSAIFLIYGLCPAAAQESKKFKVLVVMSYDEDYPWDKEVKQGIDDVLEKTCEIRYFYMDTKRNPQGGEQKAKEAYALYQEFKPDGVIASDDSAQFMFVVPYLKDKVKTPVMFCGVNADPEKYGYPASNVSGILERFHIAESVAFVQQLVPSVKTLGYITKDDPTGNAGLKQIKSESNTYPAKFVEFRTVKTLKEIISATEELKNRCDALFIITFAGTPDDNGKFMTDKEIIPIVAKIFRKPIIGATEFQIKFGVLSAVCQSVQEQGGTSANMLLKAMQGTPVSQIPITRNQKGKRMLNVTVMKALRIKPRPEVLRNTEFVKTED
jgi:ABC-type uncharacterized transport system substrate-binding protein